MFRFSFVICIYVIRLQYLTCYNSIRLGEGLGGRKAGEFCSPNCELSMHSSST